MSTQTLLIPIYTTRGDTGAFLSAPYLFSPQGEWIGWVTPERTVYSIHGKYVGRLTGDPRIVRPRETHDNLPYQAPPAPPEPVHPPALVPLAPQMPELPLNMIDVLDEAPELLPTVDTDDLRPDLD